MDSPPPTPFAPPKEKHDSKHYNDSNGRTDSNGHTDSNGPNTPTPTPNGTTPNGIAPNGTTPNGITPITPPILPTPEPAYYSLIPTGYDRYTAGLYPTTLLFGSLYSILSPDPASTHSYFSHKSNLLNTLFVKNGWLWTTIVFALHLSRLRLSTRPQALLQAFLRYTLATLWWIAVTQWFFGAPIMDRTFTITGGACRAVLHDPAAASEVLGETAVAATSAACKLAGGRWGGGHDLSGHTFLLTHASLFLWSEVMPVLEGVGGWRGWRTGAVVGLLAVWWWMLLMTGVYFHTWREKLTGWIVSMVQWSIVYVWALKTQPQIRDVVGVPGV
ncbi:uncharacterized protein H6S33_003067 [Morchella sextelata]|uniref:uncharacterized protein n=1 Tax=Morchella sextelata TaxID=1174677 RepID=UPI001D0560FE|nr:uncharacterized protein H6S33_003067 [Morchella sextelata]KAH0607079.1 hypothetical protein H6S33_003067 [Morchella sextelata]